MEPFQQSCSCVRRNGLSEASGSPINWAKSLRSHYNRWLGLGLGFIENSQESGSSEFLSQDKFNHTYQCYSYSRKGNYQCRVWNLALYFINSINKCTPKNLKKKKKRPWKQFSKFYNIFFLLKNCKKILIKGSHPHYKRLHQEPGKQN